MPKASELSNVWKTIKEVDLRPYREQALRGVNIAVVGRAGTGRHTLADQMRRDPQRPDMLGESPLKILVLEQVDQAASSDLVLLVVKAGEQISENELSLLQTLSNSGVRTLVFANTFPQAGESQAISAWQEGKRKFFVQGAATDSEFLHKYFAKTVIDLIPQHVLALGRDFPLFRLAVAHSLINDACLSNAAFSLTTGLAEIVPVFDIPLTVTDMIVLTKTQAFLAYKLGLALGFSTNWQDYLKEFGGVLGGGFIFRQLARSLVGLIPVWGILPKTAVAYAGTYVVGQAILQWYLTGRHLSSAQMRDLYRRAFIKGKTASRPLLRKRTSGKDSRLRLPGSKKHALPTGGKGKKCPNCGQMNIQEANFCQNCGFVFKELDAGTGNAT